MKKLTKWWHKGITLLLLLSMLLPVAGPELVPVAQAGKVTQEEINGLKDKANQIASQKKELQNQINAIRADKKEAQQQKNLLEQQMNLIQDEINVLLSEIESYNQLILLKEEEIADTQKQAEKQYELFCQRVRMMEEEGEISYWAILLASKDFSELLDNFMMVEEIIEYDNSVMESLNALQKKLEGDKADLDATKAELETAKAAQESAKSELSAREKEVDALISDISSKEDELEKQEAELKKAANAMDAEIKRKEKELAAQIANVPSESGYLWPLPASYNVLSSLFGGRVHPITGKKHSHTGIDLPAPRNTKIYASKSGVVVTSTYNRSYGNYVVVSHSDGTSTLYAHMNKRNATEGQTVKQGAVIGYVGTTGSSTGNHLHFEIRVSGVRKDPVNYFKDKTLYVQSGGKTAVLPH